MLDREVAGIHPYMLWKVVERKKVLPGVVSHTGQGKAELAGF